MLFVVYFPPNSYNPRETPLVGVFLMQDAALNYAARMENAKVAEVEGTWDCFKKINMALMTKLYEQEK